MSNDPRFHTRRSAIVTALTALAASSAILAPALAAAPPLRFGPTDLATSGSMHDFDFFLGAWTVKHRRLRKRLVGNNEWEEFDGTTNCQSLLGGIANMNESVSNRQGKLSRGLGLRAYDAATDSWADWTLSANNPLVIDAPGIGRFANGVGTFLSDETFENKPITVRGVFSSISPTEAQWEQAFSPDGGKTWETNWVMRYLRTS